MIEYSTCGAYPQCKATQCDCYQLYAIQRTNERKRRNEMIAKNPPVKKTEPAPEKL